jgi:hypothetical protein
MDVAISKMALPPEEKKQFQIWLNTRLEIVRVYVILNSIIGILANYSSNFEKSRVVLMHGRKNLNNSLKPAHDFYEGRYNDIDNYLGKVRQFKDEYLEKIYEKYKKGLSVVKINNESIQNEIIDKKLIEVFDPSQILNNIKIQIQHYTGKETTLSTSQHVQSLAKQLENEYISKQLHIKTLGNTLLNLLLLIIDIYNVIIAHLILQVVESHVYEPLYPIHIMCQFRDVTARNKIKQLRKIKEENSAIEEIYKVNRVFLEMFEES